MHHLAISSPIGPIYGTLNQILGISSSSKIEGHSAEFFFLSLSLFNTELHA